MGTYSKIHKFLNAHNFFNFHHEIGTLHLKIILLIREIQLNKNLWNSKYPVLRITQSDENLRAFDYNSLFYLSKLAESNIQILSLAFHLKKANIVIQSIHKSPNPKISINTKYNNIKCGVTQCWYRNASKLLGMPCMTYAVSLKETVTFQSFKKLKYSLAVNGTHWWW